MRPFWRRLAILISVLVVWGTSVAAQGQVEKTPDSRLSECEGTEAALDVTSEQMTFDRDTQTFIFEEKVRVKRCDLVIDCDHLQVVRYADENRIKHVIATGNVRFRDRARHAVADRADYYGDEQKLVLVGNARAWDVDEQNEVSGDEIIVFLAEERILVSGARVRFHPEPSSGSEP